MRGAIAVCFVTLAACASSTPGGAISTTHDVPISGSDVRIRPSDGLTVNVVPFPLDRVWAALPGVFDSLGIPINELDATRHVMGNSGFKAHKRLGKVALSKMIDCGSTQGFPSADEYDVHLSVLSQVEPDKAGPTSIATRVEAAARPMAFPGAYAKCSTKGTLEAAIVNAVTRRLER